MTRYTADELVSRIDTLNRQHLSRLVEMKLLRPVLTEGGEFYREIDLARARLCCELAEGYGLEGEALSLVMSLLDELHGTRGELRALIEALAHEPPEIRQRLTIRISRTG